MRIINLVTIKAGVVDSIESFGIFEEQLSQDVIEQAENRFIEIAKQLGWNPDDSEIDNEDDLRNEGYYECPTGTCCFVWSDI